MQSILRDLLASFHTESGVPALVFSATHNLILEMYGYDAADYFSKHVKSIDLFFYFRDGSPVADDFIREFEKIS